MSYTHLRHRKDSNEDPLVSLARQLHWGMYKLNEWGDWLGLRLGRWEIIEIKDPKREDHANEYTPKQKIFHTEVKNAGGRILVWRTESDVLRASGARVGA